MSMRIRPIEPRDLAPLTAIYNYYIAETAITFDTEPYTEEARRPWLEQFSSEGPYRCFVAESGGASCGWACSGPFRAKAAYHRSVEASVYLSHEQHSRGLGTALYEALFASLADTDVHLALAGITQPNPGSAALHRRFGFEPVGTFHEVGWKFDQYWDVAWLEKTL